MPDSKWIINFLPRAAASLCVAQAADLFVSIGRGCELTPKLLAEFFGALFCISPPDKIDCF